MLSNRLLLMTVALLVSLFTSVTKPTKVYFIDNDSLVELNGNVKQMFSIIDDSTSANQGQDFDTVKFDKQGNVTKIINGFHGAIFRHYYTTKYSANGKKLETVGSIRPNDAVGFIPGFPSSPPKPKDTSWRNILTYKYDEHGYIIQYVLKGNHHTDSTIYKYNSSGDMVEQDYYFNPTLLMDVAKYKYDENNNLIELETFHRNILRVKTRFEYDKFDPNNNWLDETVHLESSWIDDQVQTYKVHRKITYY